MHCVKFFRLGDNKRMWCKIQCIIILSGTELTIVLNKVDLGSSLKVIITDASGKL